MRSTHRMKNLCGRVLLREVGDGLHEQAALLHLDAFVQGFFGIAVEHGHGGLRQDGAGINTGVGR